MLDLSRVFWKRPDPPKEQAEPLADRVRELEHRCDVLARDVADLDDRYRRRAARYRKAGIEEEATATPPAANGKLPSVAELRALGRYPFQGR